MLVLEEEDIQFVIFTKEGIMSHSGLYLLHSISPSPQIEMEFESVYKDPIMDQIFTLVNSDVD